MKPLMLLGFLLWSATSFVVMASQESQPPASTPQAARPDPQPPAQPPPPEKKVNRFALSEDEVEEDEKLIESLKGKYSGTAGCVKCHQKEALAYQKGPHGPYWNARTPGADIGCETCHGPGKAHDAKPAAKGLVRMFSANGGNDGDDVCLTCHDRGAHAGWAGSQHEARNLSCSTCHSHHKAKSETGLLVDATALATCARCHAQVVSKMSRVSHMPVREGKMDCSSCHDPHGSTNVRLLRAGSTLNESCQSCHTEKRGPFLWEHKPVSESCAACHDPHGSSNDRMLVVRAPMLCQRCHIVSRHPATPYDALALASANNRLIGRSCVNCHPTVHGSNHPSGVFLMR